MKREVNICDICKTSVMSGNCEICGLEICRKCSNSSYVNVKGYHMFDYLICKPCSERFTGIKIELKIEQRLVNELKNSITEQLKKALVLGLLKDNEV